MNADAARFCHACGASLQAGARVREVRKTVTILFCDVVQSTGLAEDIDPEALRQLMSRYFAEMRAAVEAHGGTVEKFIGDEVMAVFGVPVVHEDDALRAVRAAADMHERLERLNSELERTFGLRLQMRVGINTGEVVAGDPSSGQAFVTGEPVVFAKRLEQAAAPGDILIGKATYPLIKDAVKAGPLERFPAKGKREPAERRRVDEVDRSAPGLLRRLDVPMVGRETELAALRTAFERTISERSCRLFTLLGPAGIGKSRLAAELSASVPGGARTVIGRCLPYGEGITFWPLAEIVRDLGGEETLRAELSTCDDADVVVELVRGATGTSSESGSSEDTFWAVRRLLEALANARPLIVCFEDIHWAEPTFLDLIEYVVGWSRDAPILVLCLARPELMDRRPSWIAPRANADTVALERLSEHQADALLERLQSEAELSEAARRRIAEAAEGNPLFVEQMVALAAETSGEAALAIPPSIHALLAERLDRLSPEERAAVERAAVIGRDFSAHAVAELTPPEERRALAGHLLGLVRKQLVRPDTSGPSPEDRFRFHHVLIRDTAYEAMPKELRAELNERLADWLEDGESGHELEELIGYHLEQAYVFRTQLGPPDAPVHALAERAATRLTSAGRRALSRGDARAAVRLLQRATKLTSAAPNRRYAILPDLGAALRDSGSLVESEEVLTEAAGAATRAGDRGAQARARIELAFTRLHRHEAVEEVRSVAEETLPVLMELADDAGLAKALTLAGLIGEYVRCNVSAGEALLERALAHAERIGDRQQMRTILTLLSKTNLDGPRPAEDAIAHLDELARRLPGDLTLEAAMATNRAPLEAMRGRFQIARELYTRGQATFEELGRSFSAANARIDSGTVELLAGDHETAEHELRSGFEALEAIGETSVRSSVAALLGRAVLAQGRAAEAERYAAISEQTSSGNDVFAQVEWRTLRAMVCARTSRLEEAERVAREAVELLEVSDALNLRAEAVAALGEALEVAERTEEARASFTEAQRLSERKGNAALASFFATRAAAQSEVGSPRRSSTVGSDAGRRAGGT